MEQYVPKVYVEACVVTPPIAFESVQKYYRW